MGPSLGIIYLEYKLIFMMYIDKLGKERSIKNVFLEDALSFIYIYVIHEFPFEEYSIIVYLIRNMY